MLSIAMVEQVLIDVLESYGLVITFKYQRSTRKT